jgi:hypothetical protein
LADARYFTRTWTEEEKAAYETEQERLSLFREAEARRKMETDRRALELEPKVNAVLTAIDGVGDYVDEAEEREEVAPYVRGIVHHTVVPVEKIAATWREVAAVAPLTSIQVAKATNRMLLRGYSMKEVIGQLDNLEPCELDPLENGETRFFFTREELVHEYTVNVAKWDALMDTHDMDTALGLDERFAVTVHAKGYAEAHPCPCEDCKRRVA